MLFHLYHCVLYLVLYTTLLQSLGIMHSAEVQLHAIVGGCLQKETLLWSQHFYWSTIPFVFVNNINVAAEFGSTKGFPH